MKTNAKRRVPLPRSPARSRSPTCKAGASVSHPVASGRPVRRRIALFTGTNNGEERCLPRGVWLSPLSKLSEWGWSWPGVEERSFPRHEEAPRRPCAVPTLLRAARPRPPSRPLLSGTRGARPRSGQPPAFSAVVTKTGTRSQPHCGHEQMGPDGCSQPAGRKC